MSSRTALSPQARLLSSAVLLLAFALRLWAIDARSLWFDEAYEYWSAVVPPGALPATVMTSFQPPLYSYLLHIWLRFGDHAVWLRWLSVAFSLVGVAGMVRLGRRWLGVRGAAIAGLVWATLPPQVKYAQEVAEYALLSALLVWLLAALAQAVDAGRWRDWMGWGLAAALAVYSHYGAAVVVLALSLTLFVQHAWQRRTAALVKQGAVSLGALLLGIPLLPILSRQMAAQARSPIAPFSGLEAEIGQLLQSAHGLFGFLVVGAPFTALPAWSFAALGDGLLALSLLLFVQDDPHLRRIAVWFWTTFAVYTLMVRLSLYAYGSFGFRYTLILAPLATLLVTAVAIWLARRSRLTEPIGWGLTLAVVGLALYSLPNRPLSEQTRGAAAWPETEDMAAIVQFWHEQRRPGDLTYIYYGAAPAFRYYARTSHLEPATPLPPTWLQSCWAGAAASFCRENEVFYGSWIRSLPVEDKLRSLEETLGEWPPRLWLIFAHVVADEDRQLLTHLPASYRVEAELRAVGAGAYLLVAP